MYVCRVSNSIDSLEYRRNVECVSFFYQDSIMEGVLARGLVPDILGLGTRTSRRAPSFVVDCPVNRTIHYKENSFFARIARLWSDLPAKVLHGGYDMLISLNQMSPNTTFFFPPSYKLFF